MFIYRSIKFSNPASKRVVEEIIEDVEEDPGPPSKSSRIEVLPQKSTEVKKQESWNRSIGVLSKKSGLANLVKSKKDSDPKSTNEVASSVASNCVDSKSGSSVSSKTVDSTSDVKGSVPNKIVDSTNEAKSSGTGLSLLAGYSGSDSDSN